MEPSPAVIRSFIGTIKEILCDGMAYTCGCMQGKSPGFDALSDEMKQRIFRQALRELSEEYCLPPDLLKLE